MRDVWTWGAAAIAAYLTVAIVSVGGLLPIRPLYDGFAPPPPYNWVDPPPDVVSPEPAEGAKGFISFEGGENLGLTTTTPDGQATAIIEQGAIEPVEGEDTVNVSVEPADPAELGRVPDGLRIDGNAYVVSAAFDGSGEDVTLRSDSSIVMRFPVHATTMLRLDGEVWTELETQIVGASLQLFSRTPELGTFAAAGPPIPGAGFNWRPIALGVAGVLAALAGWYFGRGSRSKPEANRAERRRRRRR